MFRNVVVLEFEAERIKGKSIDCRSDQFVHELRASPPTYLFLYYSTVFCSTNPKIQKYNTGPNERTSSMYKNLRFGFEMEADQILVPIFCSPPMRSRSRWGGGVHSTSTRHAHTSCMA